MGQPGEIPVCQFAALLDADRPRQRQHRSGRLVPSAVEPLDIVQRRSIQVGHRTDGGMSVGVLGWEIECQQQLQLVAVGHIVVALTLLFLDHLALGVEIVLVNVQTAHPIRLQPQGKVEGLRADGLEVVGAVEAGGCVH